MCGEREFSGCIDLGVGRGLLRGESFELGFRGGSVLPSGWLSASNCDIMIGVLGSVSVWLCASGGADGLNEGWDRMLWGPIWPVGEPSTNIQALEV